MDTLEGKFIIAVEFENTNIICVYENHCSEYPVIVFSTFTSLERIWGEYIDGNRYLSWIQV